MPPDLLLWFIEKKPSLVQKLGRRRFLNKGLNLF